MRLNKIKDMLSFCPKTGRCLGFKKGYWFLAWVWPIIGLVSLIWFLIRVIGKPSRASYPCQRMAAPLAGGFIVWIAGLIGSTLAYRKAKKSFGRNRYVLAGLCAAVAVLIVWTSLSVTSENPTQAAFVPSDPPNSPVGVGKGIYPGRVVWVHDAAAAKWDEVTGSWWQDQNTDQGVVDAMLSRAIRGLTGQTSDANAWDALFRHFNSTRGFGDVGYQPGERVTIKINMNQDSGGSWGSRSGMPSPQVIYSLVEQLIYTVGVPGAAITLYDASRFIGDPIFNKIRSNSDPNFQAVQFVVRPSYVRSGRIAAVRDTTNTVRFGSPQVPNSGTTNLPTCVTQAKYLINMALLRPHSLYGVTLCAKNHFGSVYSPSLSNWTPEPLHSHGDRSRPMGSYSCLVDLIGHRHTGGKTLLFFIDGLYPARNQSDNVVKYQTFGNNWCSSIFLSQDMVAIDSVAVDFLRSESGLTDVTGSVDNYLHEAARADNPPSGTFYDPEGDGIRLQSLGVHEHWNNSVQKQYSRNLGTDQGIELFVPPQNTEDGPVENITTGKRYDFIRHAVQEAQNGDQIVVGQGTYNENVDIADKNIILRSTDPNDQAVVTATVITGGNRAVSFSGGQTADCVLAGLTITGAKTGIYCSAASPTIRNCLIADNSTAGIEMQSGSKPTIEGCTIVGNAGCGIEMFFKMVGRETIYNQPTIANCIVAGNKKHGISGCKPTIINCTITQNTQAGITSVAPTVTSSIVYFNGTGQIVSSAATVTYSDIEGSSSGQGNITIDPCFASLGSWSDNGTAQNPADDFWVNGDYHLKSHFGRWDHTANAWVQDVVTSLCIDTGDPASDWTGEFWPHGKRINIGAYGGTAQASMSPSSVGCLADLNCDEAVNLEDLAWFGIKWQCTAVLLREDLNRDGCVNTCDLGLLADDWLRQP